MACWIISEEINLLTKLANHQAKSVHHFSLIQTFAVIWSKRGRKRPLHIQKLEVVEGWWRETFKITFFILYICSLIRGKLFLLFFSFLWEHRQTDRQTIPLSYLLVKSFYFTAWLNYYMTTQLKHISIFCIILQKATSQTYKKTCKQTC